MNRRKFVINTAMGMSAGLVVPQYLLTDNQYDTALLIGKGDPVFVGNKIKLLEEVYNAFTAMKKAAISQGIRVEIVSAYRSFKRQKEIYESKYHRFISQGLSPEESIEKIITYSTIPGTSRHHWGTDIDITDANKKVNGDLLDPKKFHGNGPFCRLKEWMDKHAKSYGFYLVYTDNFNRKGFNYEPWHYSYAAISKPMLTAYRKINIKEILIKEQLAGKEYLSDSFLNSYKRDYILGINPKLL